MPQDPKELDDFIQGFMDDYKPPTKEHQAEVAAKIGAVPEKVSAGRFTDKIYKALEEKKYQTAVAAVETGAAFLAGGGPTPAGIIGAGTVLASNLAFPVETPAQGRGEIAGAVADIAANSLFKGAGAAKAVGRAVLPALAVGAEQAGEVAAGEATPAQGIATSLFTGAAPGAMSETAGGVMGKLFGGAPDAALQRMKQGVGSTEQFGAATEQGTGRSLSRYAASVDVTNQKFSNDVRLHNLATETIKKHGLEFEPGPEGTRKMREGVLGRFAKAKTTEQVLDPEGNIKNVKRSLRGGDIIAVNEKTGRINTLDRGGPIPSGFKMVELDQLGLDQMRQVLRQDPGVLARKIGPKDENFFAVKELKKLASATEWETFRKQWASEHILRSSLIDSALDVPAGIQARLPNEKVVLDAVKFQKNIKQTVGTQMASEILGKDTVQALEDMGDVLVKNSVDLTGKGPDPLPRFVSYGFNKVAFASTVGGAMGFATVGSVPIGVGVVVGIGALTSFILDNPKAARLMKAASAGNVGALNALTRSMLSSDLLLPSGPPQPNGNIELIESPKSLDPMAHAKKRDEKGRFRTRNFNDLIRNALEDEEN